MKKLKELLKARFNLSTKNIFLLLFFAVTAIVLSGVLVLWQISTSLPPIYKVQDYKPRLVSKVFAKTQTNEQKLIGEYFLEKRTLIDYSDIPKHVVNSFIAAEDDTFFSHSGINFAAITRAAIANIKAGHVVQGGSTITQQVAKTLFLTSERNILRKIREAILAKRLESYLSKEEILYLYLNQIYLGNGAYGVEEAAQAFFRKKIHDITIAETALLAGLTRAPSAFNPLHNPTRAKERQLYVLRRMKEVGFITDAQYTEAEKQELKVFQLKKPVLDEAQYYVEHLRKGLIEKYGDKVIYEEGLNIYTPVKWNLLVSSYNALRNGVKDVDKRRGYRGPIQQIAKDAVESWLEGNKKEVIKKHLGFKYLTLDGSLKEPFTEIAISVNETYEGLVKSIDNKEKTATVLVAGVEVIVPKDGYSWARMVPTQDKKYPREPDLPSDVFKVNDVVLVQVISQSKEGAYIGRLDQKPLIEGAIVSLDVETGRVLALQGGFDFERSEFNRVFQAQRQVGSAMKPILYACAIERGMTPTSTLVDMPLSFETEEFGRWRPENYDNKFEGEISLRTAFAKSRNPPAVYLVGELGLSNVLNFTRRLGWKSHLNEDLSSALGSSSETLMNMTEIYSIFPRLGRKVSPILIDKILSSTGEVIEESTPEGVPNRLKTTLLKLRDLAGITNEGSTETNEENKVNNSLSEEKHELDPTKELIRLLSRSFPLEEDPLQVLDPRVAFIASNLMREAVLFGTGSRAQVLKKVVGGKTGTTNDYKDAWFIGFSPHVVTGVWVGYDDPSISLGEKETGAQAALPVWISFMQDALLDYPDEEFSPPPGISFVPINKVTGEVFRGVATKENNNIVMEPYIQGTEPSKNDGRLQSKPSGSRGEFLKQDFE